MKTRFFVVVNPKGKRKLVTTQSRSHLDAETEALLRAGLEDMEFKQAKILKPNQEGGKVDGEDRA